MYVILELFDVRFGLGDFIVGGEAYFFGVLCVLSVVWEFYSFRKLVIFCCLLFLRLFYF